MIVSSHSFHFTRNCPLLYTLLLECRSGSACSVLYTNTVYSVHTVLPGHSKSSRPMFQTPLPLWDLTARILRITGHGLFHEILQSFWNASISTDLVWTFFSIQLLFYFMFWFYQFVYLFMQHRVQLQKKHWLLDERIKGYQQHQGRQQQTNSRDNRNTMDPNSSKVACNSR